MAVDMSGFMSVLTSYSFLVGIIGLIILVLIIVLWLRQKGYILTDYPSPAFIIELVGGRPQLLITSARRVEETGGRVTYQLKHDKKFAPVVDYKDMFATTTGKKALVLFRLNQHEYHPAKISADGIVPELSGDAVNMVVDQLKSNINKYRNKSKWERWYPLIASFIFVVGIMLLLFVLLNKFEVLAGIAGSMLEISKVQADILARIPAAAANAGAAPPF